VFNDSRWANVFVNVLGENSETAFACLKAAVPQIKAIPCAMSGFADALRVEKMLTESMRLSLTTGGISQTAAESTIRFISLLIRKGRFRRIDSIMRIIEEQTFRQNGILVVTAESAAPMERDFEDELRRQIEKATGAKKAIIKAMHAPELLGGYRLRMGGFYIDASLKGQVERMKAGLDAAVMGKLLEVSY
jgi:F0F1-type ATP synthase delta subunit